MNVQFTHPWWLLALVPALVWAIWLARSSHVQLSAWRRWTSLGLRVVVTLALLLALAGLQWRRPVEGMNIFFLLDRSQSVPSAQQEAAREFVNQAALKKKRADRAGVIVFGTEASIETMPNAIVDLKKVQAVVTEDRTDLAAAIRLGTAAFPETGQKRLVIASDGNENLGDALAAALAARPLGVSVDVLPLGVERPNDTSVQRVQVPSQVKARQSFDAKAFIHSDIPRTARVQFLRNDQPISLDTLQLEAGKNLIKLPETLDTPGFYKYEVQVDAPGDLRPENNRAVAFVNVQGQPRLLIVSSDPAEEGALAAALQATNRVVELRGLNGLPASIAELQSFDAIFLCNIAAGDMGQDRMKLLESAVRDFGVGLVCVGGPESFTAGGYRGTPLEETLPVSMELESKKVLPNGAIVLVMHGMEFNNGNQVARDCAQGVLNALSPQDEMGIVFWDGTERWVFELQKAANKNKLGGLIAGMQQGDMPAFEGPLREAHNALKKSRASLKHIIVFSDGDPAPPSAPLMSAIVGDRVTVSTVLISGHSGPQTMQFIADRGKGRFYNVTSPDDLPQIFIKEAGVILKTAIYEDPFRPQQRFASELLEGIPAAELPPLLGYVATTAKPRAETPLWTDKDDPLLAHWQYGLGRAVAFTSDAKARWAREWLGWGRYKQFWSQTASWSMRRLENANLASEVLLDRGEGLVAVEAVDADGNYRNFLNLQAVVVDPKGGRFPMRLEQVGPGRYEARFPTKQVGAYLVRLSEIEQGRLRGVQTVGASVNYSPEFVEAQPNLNLLRRLAESGGGRVLDPLNPADNPFLHGRQRTFQPRDLWEWLLKLAIVLFTLDVGVRRVQIERDEWLRATASLRRALFFWRGVERPPEADESLAALLARRSEVRERTTGPAVEMRPELLRPRETAAPIILTSGSGDTPQPPPPPAVAPVPETAPEQAEDGSTASRLLAAKRRAQQRRK